MRRLCGVLVMVWPGFAQAEEARYAFRWEGAGGYEMTGAMSIDAALVPGRLVRETDVTCFVIEGFLDGDPIGRWALTQLNEETTWRLFFDAGAEKFFVVGDGVAMPQAWNMDGHGTDCGDGGFGFNLGNLGQDLCVNNQILIDSRIAPPVPFPVTRDDSLRLPMDACLGPDLLSGVPNAVGG